MTTLDPTRIALNGTHLIQASAGTGKTYMAALLVLRLVMEKKIGMRELAVVTYTIPAATELAARIRTQISEALAWLSAQKESVSEGTEAEQTSPVGQLVAQACQKDSRAAVQKALSLAELDVDLAVITTIHGFCARLLKEFSFELNVENDFEVLADENELVEEILADFWRIKIAVMTECHQRWVSTLTPSCLKKKLFPLLQFSWLHPQVPDPRPNADPTDFLKDLGDLESAWKEAKTPLTELLQKNAKVFNQQTYSTKKIETYFQKFEDALKKGNLTDNNLMKFSKDSLAEGFNKNQNVRLPDLHFFELLEKLRLKWGNFPVNFTSDLVTQAHEFLLRELRRRKQKNRQKSYQDLITGVAEGLEKASPKNLSLLRRRFKAVLIDEFQDTDFLQWQIFSTLFFEEKTGPQCFLGLIGDPKQAIYRFRGGDIHTFVKARRSVAPERQWTLDKNFRSEARLLKALEGLYTQDFPADSGGAFLTNDIAFEPVLACSGLAPVRQGTQILPPVTFWPLNKDPNVELEPLAHAIFAEITNLLDKKTEIGKPENRRPLRPQDIAILVRSHKSAHQIFKILTRQGLRVVLGKSRNVLASSEAQEVSILLAAVLEPSRESRLRELLVSPLYGYDLKKIETWAADDEAREGLAETLSAFRRNWESRGVAFALENYLFQQGGFSAPSDASLALLQDRRITNFRHLIELFNQQEQEQGKNPSRTFLWWQQLKNNEDPLYEERLESDEEAVQIVTMHKSKGLQWPVVFAVELWRGPNNAQAHLPLFHEEDELVCSFYPEHQERIKEEARAGTQEEAQRLAYVSLTRAESLLYVVVPEQSANKDGDKNSPASWLLTNPALGQLADEVGPLIQVQDSLPGFTSPPKAPPQPEGVRPPESWKRSPPLESRWSISSYSGLAGEHVGIPRTSSSPVEGPWANFPKGTTAGTLLHSIFEKIDFLAVAGADLPQDESEKVAKNLRLAQIDPEVHLATVVQGVQTILRSPCLATDSEFSLSKLSHSDRSAEIEFYLSAAHPDHARAPLTDHTLLEALGPQYPVNLKAFQLAGFLHGFIDLVFTWKNRWYILDWKSNYLGGDYSRESIEAAMAENNYHLQYLLYTVAWTRYLRSSLKDFDYERDFGGVLYLFLRGVDATLDETGQPRGVFFKRPDATIINRLEALL
jgi:exodeoxyribonuclease V beta subunit